MSNSQFQLHIECIITKVFMYVKQDFWYTFMLKSTVLTLECLFYVLVYFKRKLYLVNTEVL